MASGLIRISTWHAWNMNNLCGWKQNVNAVKSTSISENCAQDGQIWMLSKTRCSILNKWTSLMQGRFETTSRFSLLGHTHSDLVYKAATWFLSRKSNREKGREKLPTKEYPQFITAWELWKYDLWDHCCQKLIVKDVHPKLASSDYSFSVSYL